MPVWIAVVNLLISELARCVRLNSLSFLLLSYALLLLCFVFLSPFFFLSGPVTGPRLATGQPLVHTVNSFLCLFMFIAPFFVCD